MTVGGTAGEPADLLETAVPVLGKLAPTRALRALRTSRSRPWASAALAAGLVVVATTLFTAHAERSLVEGLERGGFEAVFIAAGLAIVRGLVRLRARSGPGRAGPASFQ